MKMPMLALIVLLLSGCSTPITLRHPQTERTVTCGPYSMFGGAAMMAAVEREKQCIADYQRQGYERVPE